MKLMDDLIPMRLYPAKKRVMLPVDSRDKKHGSAIFLMGESMAINQELLNMEYLYKGNRLFRSYYIDRNVADYINSTAINSEDIQESAINEGIIHTNTNVFTFENVGTMDQQILDKVYNNDTFDWCLKRLGLRESSIKQITVCLHRTEKDLQKNLKIPDNKSVYSYTDGITIHILQKLEYDEDHMDGPYDLYCLHELFYCLIINNFPNVSQKIATCTAMALSGQIEYLRKEKEVDQFKYHDTKDKKFNGNTIDGLYIADVIFGLYKTKGGYGIKRFLEGDLSGFNKVANRRILAWFDTSFKESFAEGTLTAKEKSKLKDSDYGIPSKKKYPMPDESHIKAAIRMFNHCSEEDEAELARAIKRKMKEYNLTDVKISNKNRLSKYVSESMILQEYTILDSKQPNPSQMGFYSGEGEKKRWNSIVEIDGKKYRERSEILLIKDGKIFISRQDDGTYKIPGGGTEPDKSCEEQCSRECQEEAFITPKNLKYVLTYKDKYPNQNPNNDYVGHVTYLYIGEYDRKFTGNVAPTDKDSRISKGDFFEIEEIYDELTEPHKQGLMKYFNIHEAVININELATSSTINKDFKKKSKLQLSSFKSKQIDDDICDQYDLSHIDTGNNCSGEVYLDKNGDLVGYINTKEKDDGTIWIQGLEVAEDYQSHGLSSQLLKVAKTKYHATNLSVNKNNQVAYNLYKKNGFKEYDKTDRMIFMSINSNYKESASVNPDIPYLEYGSSTGEPFAANHSESYYDVLEILSTLSFEEFDKVSFYSTYKNSDSIKKRIILKDPNNTPMSFMDIYWFPNRPHEAQITTAVSGYYRGHHLCDMMLRQLMDCGFAEEYEIYTYVWNANPENEASRKIALSNRFALRSEDLDEYGRLRYEYHTPLYKKFSDYDLQKLPESALVLDESTVFIFHEAEEVEAKYDKKLRRYLYKERLKNIREVLPLYEYIKANNPDIDRTYRDLKLYKGQNVYVDVSYYHGLYLENANMNRSKRSIYMYLDFLTRLMDTKEFKPMYHKFTYFIPAFKKPGIDVLDWKSNINIISIILYLAKKDPDKLKRWGAGKKFVFLGNTGYLLIDFNTFNPKNYTRLKSHLSKLINNSVIIDNDPEDDDEVLDSSENETKGATVELVERLEQNKGIKIDDISRIGSANNVGHLIMNTDIVSINKTPESTAIMVLTPSTSSFKSEIEDKNLKSKNITICYKPRIGL